MQLAQRSLHASRRPGMHGVGLHSSRCVLRAGTHANAYRTNYGAVVRPLALGGWARGFATGMPRPQPKPPSASAAGLGTLSDDESSSAQPGYAVDSAEAAAKLARRRAKMLKPYLMPSPKRGIIGSSKYAERLRKQVVAAARDTQRRPVMVFGESGLEKSNIAALIHFSGPGRNTNLVALDCARLDWSGAELFGRGDKEGLVEAVGDGTLLLKNVHKLPPSLLPRLRRLLAERTYRRATVSLATLGQGAVALSSTDMAPAEALPPLKRVTCRILMTASKQVPSIDGVTEVIKVPPLRLRPADVRDLQKYYLRELARRQGSGGGSMPRLSITDAALKQLESYNWPGNQIELAATVERAVLQQQQQAAAAAAGGGAASSGAGEWSGRLSEEVFWVAKQAKDRLRLNLLAAYPPLRSFLRSELWPNDINFKFTAYVYPVVVALLLWGPQDRLHSPALAVFWDYWWPLVFVSFPFLGRVWCAVCPFMIYGELVQKWRTSAGAKLLKWPKEQAEQYGPIFLFSLFAAILMWEQVWDLPNTAYLSGWLLIIITAGAVICSSIFERRLWCRYLCPIGGMNGMFAKLSMTEVRARHGVCASECSTYHCYKGGCAQPPVGLESPGCPLYSHPAQLTDNRNCTNCMECLKACPNGSVEVRLRLPGTDLWSGHTASVAEVSLMFMLLGAVYLHHLPQLVGQVGLEAPALGLTSVTPQHILVSFAVLFAPGLAAWGADVAGRAAAARGIDVAAMAGNVLSDALSRVSGSKSLISHGSTSVAGAQGAGAVAAVPTEAAAAAPAQQPAPFLELAYGYLPFVWAATLAHYLPDLLGQGGHILQIAAASVGFEDAPLPAVEANPAVVSFLQGTLLLFGAGSSAALSRKLAAAPWSTFLPQLAGISVLTAELWALLLP